MSPFAAGVVVGTLSTFGVVLLSVVVGVLVGKAIDNDTDPAAEALWDDELGRPATADELATRRARGGPR